MEEKEQSYVQVSELIPNVLANLGKDTMGLPTGIGSLDKTIRGLHPSDYVIIGARTSQGKTALAVDIILSVSKEVPVALFSLEMDNKSLVERMISNLAEVSHHKLCGGEIEQDSRAWSDVLKACATLSKLPIIIDDSSTLSTTRLREKLLGIKSEFGIGCVIIDYLQLMTSGRPESRQQEVSDMSRGLKQINKDFGIPVIALCQIRRAAQGEGPRPKIEMLRESGSIEQDADKIILIHNKDVLDNRESGFEGTGEAELIVAKHRNGPTGTLDVGWMFDYMSFMEK